MKYKYNSAKTVKTEGVVRFVVYWVIVQLCLVRLIPCH